MPLRDYMSGRRPVSIHGVPYWIKTPTLETVETAFALFGLEIQAASQAARAAGAGREALSPAVRAVVAQNPAGVARVLATCCQGPTDPQTWPLAELILAVLGELDLARFESVFLGPPAAAPIADPWAVTDTDVSLAQTAHYFGVTPCDIMGWPVWAFVSAQEAARLAHEGKGAPRQGTGAEVDALQRMAGG